MRRYGIALAAFALLAAGCGQYSGVHDRAVSQGQISAGQTGITSPTGTTGTTGTGTGTGITGGGTGTTGTTATGTGTTATGTTGTTGTDATGGTSAAPAATGPGTTTGVTPTSIKIGIHAPLTGAAPLKAESFNHGKDLYWLKGNNGKPVEIYGRKVEVVFQDDQYNPSHARSVCAQMAEQQQAFLLIGGGGTDQIQSCAVYAASKGIPYLSAGVTETGLTKLPNYFAVSMSYADQVPLLVKYMKANASSLAWNGDPARVAAVITNSPNFDDAASAFGQSLPGATIIRPEKNERGQSMAARLCTGTLKNFDVVFPLTAPTYFLEMAGSSKCNPQYMGVGVSMGLNQVASVGCQTGGVANARFFSPAPAYIDAAKYDPAFKAAGGLDDIEFLLWGISKTLHQLFLKAGQNLTREGFIAST
ncbi:MAG TPA: ABC transporter substrate-binding protein, partial [Actinomycetota bacterium]|nr:ABC transporter substrate-binding protein [Actinomycetota bacterium]